MLTSILIIWYIAIVNGLNVPPLVDVVMSGIIVWRLFNFFKFWYIVSTHWDDFKKEVEAKRARN